MYQESPFNKPLVFALNHSESMLLLYCWWFKVCNFFSPPTLLTVFVIKELVHDGRVVLYSNEIWDHDQVHDT